MVRIEPKLFEKIAKTERIEPTVHDGKIMPGFIFVNIEDLTHQKLQFWIEMALEYNKVTLTSKTKKQKLN